MADTYTHKALINLSFIDGKDMWQLIRSLDTKYSASRVDTGTKMKYFDQGIILKTAKDFRKEYRDQSTYEPMSNWVLLISLSGDLEPNGKEIIRKRNRTSLVVSCSLENVIEGGQHWPDPGLALDPKIIKFKTTHIDYRTGKASIRCQLPQGLELKETVFMYTALYQKFFARMMTELSALNEMAKVDHFETKEGADALIEIMMKTSAQLGFNRPSAGPARERLAQWFTSGDDPAAYVHKGVAFLNEKEFLDLMSTRDNNEELVLRFKHDLPILEKLMDTHRDDIDARLKTMDLMQLQSKMYIKEPFMDYRVGLSEEEYEQHEAEWYAAKESHAEQFVEDKWRTLVIQRWKALQ